VSRGGSIGRAWSRLIAARGPSLSQGGAVGSSGRNYRGGVAATGAATESGAVQGCAIHGCGSRMVQNVDTAEIARSGW